MVETMVAELRGFQRMQGKALVEVAAKKMGEVGIRGGWLHSQTDNIGKQPKDSGN